jgi:uroporphyrinogen-III synthase
MRPLIIVRPEPGASATKARALELGLDAHSIPLFTVEPMVWAAPDPAAFDALLLTSANAVRHAGPQLALLAALPCLCVGTATAAAARAAGLTVAATGDAGAQPLVDSMTSRGHHKLLWLTGEDRTALSSDHAHITPRICYRAAAIAAPPGWADAIAVPAVLLLHSPRAARQAAASAGEAKAHLTGVAISDAVAAAAGPGWEAIHIAARPGDADMLALAAKLCQTQRP